MYGYKTKHEILATYTNWQNNHVPEYLAGRKLEAEELFLLAQKVKRKYYYNNVLHLEYEGYLEIDRTTPEKNFLILTMKGRSAALSGLFKEKNEDLIISRSVNIGLLFSNLCIAAVTIITIVKDNPKADILAIQSQLETLKLEVKTIKQQKTQIYIPSSRAIDTLALKAHQIEIYIK